MQTIIVFTEKHGDRYFDASTPELKARACAKILRERRDEGYWYNREYEAPEPTFTPEEKETLAMTDEQVALFPSRLRETVEKKRASLRGRRGAYARNKLAEDQFFTALDLVLSVPAEEAYRFTTNDVEGFGRRITRSLALELIDARADGEYEGYDFVTLE